MKVRITLTGTAPLLMHNVRLANPLDPIKKEIQSYTSKRKKTDDDLEQIARLEFIGGLYFYDTIGPYLPNINVEQAFRQGASLTKRGKTIERGLWITDVDIPLIYDGPRDIDGLWADEQFRLVAMVKVGQNRNLRVRPMFKQWAIECEAQIDESVLDLTNLQDIASQSGMLTGIGDWRPRYGRYQALVEEF